MRRFFRWVIWVPVFLLCMAFAVANRQRVVLSLDPFSDGTPAYGLELQLWLLLFIGIFLGVILGWLACWRAQGRWRKLARERQKEISRLQTELVAVREGPRRPDPQAMVPLPGIMP